MEDSDRERERARDERDARKIKWIAEKKLCEI